MPVGTHDLFVPPELPLGKSTHIAPWSWEYGVGSSVRLTFALCFRSYAVVTSVVQLRVLSRKGAGAIHANTYMGTWTSSDSISWFRAELISCCLMRDPALDKAILAPHWLVHFRKLTEVVFTRSSLVEQTTPAFINISSIPALEFASLSF